MALNANYFLFLKRTWLYYVASSQRASLSRTLLALSHTLSSCHFLSPSHSAVVMKCNIYIQILLFIYFLKITAYYYPTAKKRYLPRIQKVTNEIGTVPDAIAAADWDTVNNFSKTAENAILPLQLYQSSLDGQGLSMSNSYAKVMKEDALKYEKSYKVFAKAIQKTDADTALQAVTDMGVAIADYRQQGRLRDDDGNIPSVDDMRRMAMRKPTVVVVR